MGCTAGTQSGAGAGGCVRPVGTSRQPKQGWRLSCFAGFWSGFTYAPSPTPLGDLGSVRQVIQRCLQIANHAWQGLAVPVKTAT